MRLALISDIHANEIALETVLADMERSAVDRLVCLGDVATLGPRPEAVIDRLRRLGCLCILGNHDDFLLRPDLVQRYTEARSVVAAVAWCEARLSAADRAFLASFQSRAEVPLTPAVTLLAYHGSPRSHTEEILATTPAAELDRLLEGCDAPLLAGGHTHIQMLRQHRGALLVNPGSVGLPFEEHVSGRPPALLPHAEYAIVEARGGDVLVELRRLALDLTALIAAADASDNPICAYQAEQFRALAARREGRPATAAHGDGGAVAPDRPTRAASGATGGPRAPDDPAFGGEVVG